MKAVRLDHYGDVDVLKVAEVERPPATQDRVLVRVVTAGTNPGEIAIREGLLDEMLPATFPSGQGTDFAGVVAELGDGREQSRGGGRRSSAGPTNAPPRPSTSPSPRSRSSSSPKPSIGTLQAPSTSSQLRRRLLSTPSTLSQEKPSWSPEPPAVWARLRPSLRSAPEPQSSGLRDLHTTTGCAP